MFAHSMKSYTALLFLSFIVYVAFWMAGTGCAVQVPPSGGPRDSLPPVMEKSWPADSSTNFRDKRIILAFNEYVGVDNPQQNVIVSPLPKNNPVITHKLNEITVKLRDTLEDNTTYTINFGNSIKDINEGNVYKNYTYVFSTGPTMDKASISGKVVQSATGEPDSTLIVMLHVSGDDSAVLKEKPRYVTRLDGKGMFTFNNLPSKQFYVYALKDNGMYKYLNTSQDFAFLNTPVIAGGNNDSIVLYAFTRGEEKKQTSGGTNRLVNPTDKRLKFNLALLNGKLDVKKPLTLSFEYPLKMWDSNKIKLVSDTTFTPVTGYHWVLDSAKTRLQLNYTWQENRLYHLILEKDFAIDTFNRQLFKKDTVSFTAMSKDDYAGFKIRFKNINSIKNPVLQLVENNTVVYTYPLSTELLTKNYLPAGEFTMRIVSDVNNNGRWDTGNFFKGHVQPEHVITLPRKLTLKAGRLEEFEVVLP